MSKIAKLVFVVAFLIFLASSPIYADTMAVSFWAGDFGQLPESVTGSFLWNPATNSIWNVTLNSTGPLTFLPAVFASEFATGSDGSGYPAGSIKFLDFQDSFGNNFQINYGDHAFLDPPLRPLPGDYKFVPFDIGFNGNFSGTGEVVVKSTPEPGAGLLLGLGTFACALSLGFVARGKNRNMSPRAR